MRIKVRSKDSSFRFWLPNRLLLNPLSAAICTKVLKSKNNEKWKANNAVIDTRENHNAITYSAMLKLFKAIRKSRRVLKGQPLVSAKSSNGEVVEIWL